MDPVSGVLIVSLLGLLGYSAFQQWIRHQRRQMLHRERMAAFEKGLPAPEEVARSGWDVQRFLLFAGLIWLSLGVGSYLVLDALVSQPPFRILWGQDRVGQQIWVDVPIRDGMQWIGATIAGIGITHLIVFVVGLRRDAR